MRLLKAAIRAWQMLRVATVSQTHAKEYDAILKELEQAIAETV